MIKKLHFVLATLLLAIGVSVNAAEIDKTAVVKTDVASWHAGGGPVNMGGIMMPEHYQQPPTIETGDVMYQDVTGLENGTYKVVLYAKACSTNERSGCITLEGDLTSYTYVYANSVQVPCNAINNSALIAPDEYTLENVQVTDGTLKLGIAKYKNGTNWHTIQIKYLALVVDDYPAYEIALATANAIAEKALPTAAKAALDAVITANKDLTKESASDALIAATEALNNAVNTAELIVAEYAQAQLFLGYCEQAAQESTTADEANRTAFTEAIAAAKTTFDAATTVEAMKAAFNPLEAARQTYFLVAYPTGDVTFDMSFVVKNADLSTNPKEAGWTVTGEGKGSGDRWGWENGAAEAYSAWSGDDSAPSGETDQMGKYSMLQEVTLSAGTYTLTANGFYRYKNDVTSEISNAYLVAGENKVLIRTIGSEPNSGNPNSLVASKNAFANGLYKNTLEFTLAEETTITIGVEGTHPIEEVSCCWFTVGPFSLAMTAGPEAPVENVTADPADGSTVTTDLSSLAITFTNATTVEVNPEAVPVVNFHNAETGELAYALNTTFAVEGNVATMTYVLMMNMAIPFFQEVGVYTLEFPAGMFLVDGKPSGKFALNYVVEEATIVLELATNPKDGATVETLETINVTFVNFDLAGPNYSTNDVIVILKDGVEYKTLTADAVSYEWEYAENVWDINVGLTEAGKYTINVPENFFELGMAYKASPAFTLTYTLTGATGGEVEKNVIYSWESPEGTVIETGGKAECVNGVDERLNYKQADYYTMCLNGKKNNLNDTEPSKNATHIKITLDQALAVGDVINVTGFCNKNEQKDASIYFDYGTIQVEDPYLYPNIGLGEEIKTFSYDVPAEAAGQSVIRLTRYQGGTNVFITKFEIVREKSGDNPGTGINEAITAEKVSAQYFSVNGAALAAPVKGLNIVKYTLANGKVVTAKVIIK